MGQRETICWKCKNGANECSWLRDFTPVENWEAKPTRIRTVQNKYINSYLVKQCPLFEPTEIDDGLTPLKRKCKELGISVSTYHYRLRKGKIMETNKESKTNNIDNSYLENKRSRRTKYRLEIYRKDILVDKECAKRVDTLVDIFKEYYTETIKLPNYSFKLFCDNIEMTEEQLKGVGIK